MEPTTESTNFIIKAFTEGGPVPMTVIAVIGLMSLYIIVDRAFKMGSLILNKREFSENIFRMVISGDVRQAISFCDSRPAPLSNTVKAGLIQALNKRPDEEVQVAMDAAIIREMPKLEGGVSFLAVFGNLSVLAGLLGTIMGMIISFGSIALEADPAQKGIKLAAGISHALNCTAFGLTVALISSLAYGYFQHRIQKTENEMVETSMSLLNLVVSNRNKIKE